MKEEYKKSVLDYYKFVDESNIPALLSLFSEDVYYRRCTLELKGMEEFEKFYRKGRSISGKHTIDNIFSGPNDSIVVEGHFDGKWKDGRTLFLRFSDFFFFNKEGKIYKRHTYTDVGQV